MRKLCTALSSLLISSAALAHDINTQRRVRYLGAHIHIKLALGQIVHVIREAFPVPAQTLV